MAKATTHKIFGDLPPFDLLEDWLALAQKTELRDADAAALATVSRHGLPSVRMVLVRGIDKAKQRVCFYTNYTSNKAVDLAATGRAAVAFHWKSQNRQVRLQGATTRLTPTESDAYFASRPYASQIGAWASQQSAPLPSHDILKARVAEFTKKYSDTPPRPEFWGGFALSPLAMEFWQEGDARLHHRLAFTRTSETDSHWQRQELYP